MLSRSAVATVRRCAVIRQHPSSSSLISSSFVVEDDCRNNHIIQQTTTTTTRTTRSMGTGTRGARGHGWFQKYREGKGGRHLQGRYHFRNVEELLNINEQVFAMNDDSNNTTTDNKVYMDISIDGEEAKRVVIELASRALPRTCTNFVELCNNSDESLWGYEKSTVFKIEKGVGVCLGADFQRCHPSVADPTAKIPFTFPHEHHAVSHAGPGIVSMLSSGLDKNESRFIITTADAPQLDGRYVAFGRVVEGLDYILKDIGENVYTRRGKPAVDIQIVSCGSL